MRQKISTEKPVFVFLLEIVHFSDFSTIKKLPMFQEFQLFYTAFTFLQQEKISVI
jgi:hypothetical protein